MLNIIPIPAFNDNYIWMLHDNQYAVVVDPGDAAPVLAYLNLHKLQLAAILCTHHHYDHVGGVSKLIELYNVPVYGPRLENIPSVTHKLGDGDVIEIPEFNIKLSVLDIPGHTLGHIAYLGVGSVFCGDTLFACGCGRLFEGTAAQLLDSLQRLANLPDETKVYCGHEYTEANIIFALVCEPDNARLKQRQADVKILRAAGYPTLPSTIVLEKATNPFLRCAEPSVIATTMQMTQVKDSSEISIFTALRTLKNSF
ncbi:hydroxyacylglutathione hydrolase [Candidatus Nitrotoga sp. M5]|uniref:hydroxyacylglutathione hydrolase n=1 Tax=Candidatus Nitrotoga sp. M5 TaxID=2890409 RepID=UPI001EF584C2|nr:hydroxyacylglutathione hydrolase [Candidatus Nitrotoga sp. M5]CAH1387069.1 hydroxyacylglutathione hydrolase GloB [Candidatus Nitrotoga sp. M5]